MLVADEMQRLADAWPHLPAVGDDAVPIPPTHSGHSRAVPGTSPPLEIVYVSDSAQLHFVTVRRR
jgi:hypothetical protein